MLQSLVGLVVHGLSIAMVVGVWGSGGEGMSVIVPALLGCLPQVLGALLGLGKLLRFLSRFGCAECWVF